MRSQVRMSVIKVTVPQRPEYRQGHLGIIMYLCRSAAESPSASLTSLATALRRRQISQKPEMSLSSTTTSSEQQLYKIGVGLLLTTHKALKREPSGTNKHDRFDFCYVCSVLDASTQHTRLFLWLAALARRGLPSTSLDWFGFSQPAAKIGWLPLRGPVNRSRNALPGSHGSTVCWSVNPQIMQTGYQWRPGEKWRL